VGRWRLGIGWARWAQLARVRLGFTRRWRCRAARLARVSVLRFVPGGGGSGGLVQDGGGGATVRWVATWGGRGFPVPLGRNVEDVFGSEPGVRSCFLLSSSCHARRGLRIAPSTKRSENEWASEIARTSQWPMGFMRSKRRIVD